MLDPAGKMFPDISCHLGNLIDIILATDFDAMICLSGSIGFVNTVDLLRTSLTRIATHLRPMGWP